MSTHEERKEHAENLDVTPRQDTAVAAKQDKPRGFEEQTDRSDLLIPRAKKIEALSPELEDDSLELKPGMIVNSITKEVLPEKFIPVFFFKSWIKFNPRDTKHPDFNSDFGPGDMIYKTNNPNDERLKEDGVWKGDNPPKATAFLGFFSIFEGQNMPIIVSFGSTNYKAGKTLLSLAKFAGGDMFGKKYSLTTKKTQNDKGTFYTFGVKMAGLPTDEEYKKAEGLYDSFRGKDIQVHEEAPEDTSVPF